MEQAATQDEQRLSPLGTRRRVRRRNAQVQHQVGDRPRARTYHSIYDVAVLTFTCSTHGLPYWACQTTLGGPLSSWNSRVFLVADLQMPGLVRFSNVPRFAAAELVMA